MSTNEKMTVNKKIIDYVLNNFFFVPVVNNPINYQNILSQTLFNISMSSALYW